MICDCFIIKGHSSNYSGSELNLFVNPFLIPPNSWSKYQNLDIGTFLSLKNPSFFRLIGISKHQVSFFSNSCKDSHHSKKKKDISFLRLLESSWFHSFDEHVCKYLSVYQIHPVQIEKDSYVVV